MFVEKEAEGKKGIYQRFIGNMLSPSSGQKSQLDFLDFKIFA
jgi:hypothetical protein